MAIYVNLLTSPDRARRKVRSLANLTRAALAILAATACQDLLPTVPEPEVLEVPVSCADAPGRVLSGTVSGTLKASAGPFHLEGDTVRAQGLFIEAGVLVCGGPFATLVVLDSLVASGTAEGPIVFTATDPSRPWGGIVGPPEFEGFATLASVRMSHARIEHAQVGLRRLRVDLRWLHLRRITGVAIDAEGTLEEVVADTVCALCRGVAGAALQASYGYRTAIRTLSLRGTLVRGSGGQGLEVGSSARASANDLEIVDPAGSGIVLAVGFPPHRPGVLSVEGPVEVRGQNAYLAVGPTEGVASFLETYAERSRPGDSVYSVGSTQRDVVIGEGVLWRAVPSSTRSRPRSCHWRPTARPTTP